jgi:predicted amidohydrolase YtcJ
MDTPDWATGFIGKGTRTFDAEQMAIVPGFIDGHNHAAFNVLNHAEFWPPEAARNVWYLWTNQRNLPLL